jgi:hypothetical protein
MLLMMRDMRRDAASERRALPIRAAQRRAADLLRLTRERY